MTFHTFTCLAVSALLLGCASAAQTKTQTCKTVRPPNPLGHRIAQAALNEYQEFNGHRINVNGYLWKSGSTESETELLHNPSSGQADARRTDRYVWRRVWTYWVTLQKHSSEDALARKIISVPGLLGQPATSARPEQLRLRELFSSFRAANRNTDSALRQAAVRAAVSDAPWSATFISYLMSQARVSEQQFHYSSAHWKYIKSAFEQPPGYAYKACDVRTTVPAVGDLLCYARGRSPLRNFGQWRQQSRQPGFSAPAHCEVVTEVNLRRKRIESIGGNVLQSVARRQLKLNAKNRLSTSYRPESAQKDPSQDCQRDKTCHQPNLNVQYWGVLLQLQ